MGQKICVNCHYHRSIGEYVNQCSYYLSSIVNIVTGKSVEDGWRSCERERTDFSFMERLYDPKLRYICGEKGKHFKQKEQ